MWEAGLPELVQQQGQGEVHVLAALLLALHCGTSAAAAARKKKKKKTLHLSTGPEWMSASKSACIAQSYLYIHSHMFAMFGDASQK